MPQSGSSLDSAGRHVTIKVPSEIVLWQPAALFSPLPSAIFASSEIQERFALLCENGKESKTNETDYEGDGYSAIKRQPSIC
jgi:hypothetical protein